MELISRINNSQPGKILFYLSLIILVGLVVRFYYLPTEIPIVTDGFFQFVYANKMILEEGLPIGYSTTSTGWSYFLSFFFLLADSNDPLQLMQIQRISSIIFSSIVIIPAFYIFKKFVNTKWALFGSFALVMEPRLLLMSIEGLNFSLYFFIFVSIIALFLNKKNYTFYISFVCIALLSLVRYEGVLLLAPAIILYLLKSNEKRSILNLLVMIGLVIIILMPIAVLRMEATENICYDYIFDTICGGDGITQNVVDGVNFFYDRGIMQNPIENPEREIFEHLKGLDKTSGKYLFEPVFSKVIENFSKFIIWSMLPYFIVFFLISLILIIKKRKFKFNWNDKTIVVITGVMLIPAIYAYAREIDEIRYVLIIIPLICLISISSSKLFSNKFFENKKLLVVVIIFVLFSSAVFLEFKKRDVILDYETFVVAKKIIEMTDRTNSYYQDGYIKTALLLSNWPEIPDPKDNGKPNHGFERVLVDKNSVEQFLIDSEEAKLEYIVIDNKNNLFDEFEKQITKYNYLEKQFDSRDLDFENKFSIYKINYMKKGML